jgi:hypothetical protein
MVRAVQDADMAMRRIRTSAFPPTKHAHILAERYNCVNADSLRALIVASPIGIADGLLETVVPDTDYSQGYASNIMKALPIYTDMGRPVRRTGPVLGTEQSSVAPFRSLNA